MKKVAILMSTYNGSKYLEEQLNSLLNLNHENLDIQIIIRDDGSTDDTLEILKEYSEKNKKINYYTGNNKGPAYSFLDMVYKYNDFDYYSFCDQDDFWEEPKIEQAVRKMKNFEEIPTVYFTPVKLVDSKLKYISTCKNSITISLATSMMVNPAIGCTLVFNKKMRDIVVKSRPSGNIGMHDSWIYRIAQALDAKIIYDNISYIKYRQHENNVMGISTKRTLKKYFEYLFRKKKRVIGNVSYLIYKDYKDIISKENEKILNSIIQVYLKNDFLSKIKLLFNRNFRSNNIKENLKFNYDVIFNKIYSKKEMEEK